MKTYTSECSASVRQRRVFLAPKPAIPCLFLFSILTTSGASITVPGTSDPWLAGMPDGATASLGDVAPDHSPVLIPDLDLRTGLRLSFSVTGGVAYHAEVPLSHPDGHVLTLHYPAPGNENGIASVNAPTDALMGVFLGSELPDLSAAPEGLDFSDPASREYLLLAPLLKQVFFIGDGRTGQGQIQDVKVPEGATRLFLGSMDGSGWYNNIGEFSVEVVSRHVGPATWTVPSDFATIQEAIDAADHGDAIVVGPGLYRGKLDFKSKDIVLRSEQGPEVTTIVPTIDERWGSGARIGPRGELTGFTVRVPYNLFGTAVEVIGVGTRIVANIFTEESQRFSVGNGAISGNFASPVIERNLFINIRGNAETGSAAVDFMNQSSPRIVNNVFAENGCKGLSLGLPTPASPEVINNTFIGNVIGLELGPEFAVCRNNLFMSNEVGVYGNDYFEPDSPLWQNNLVFDNGVNYSGMTDQTGIAGNLSVDPELRSPGTGDYHLTLGSPAADAGLAAGAPLTDFDGQVRPVDGNGDAEKRYDIGAFEYHPAPPLVTVGVVAISLEQGVRLVWQANHDAVSYSIFRSTDATGPFEMLAETASADYDDSGLTAEAVFYYLVKAANPYGESESSEVVSARVGNMPPTLANDVLHVQEDSPTQSFVLSNDTDPNDDPLTLVDFTQATNGVVSMPSPTELRYLPSPNFFGTDGFTYRATDGRGATNTASVTVHVSAVNDAPTMEAQGFLMSEGSTLLLPVVGADIDGDTLHFEVSSPPTSGMILPWSAERGGFEYRPARWFSGTDIFRAVASDGSLLSRPAVISIEVTPKAEADVDDDQMADYWENIHDLNNPAADRDGDGLSNYSEYVANTDPNDPGSLLECVSLTLDAEGHATLTWEAAGGTRYRVEYMDGGSGSWEFIALQRPVLEEMSAVEDGVQTTLSFLDDFSLTPGPPPSGVRMYRVRVVH